MSVNVYNLKFSYGLQEILRGVSFHAAGGKLLAVLGPNGVGKTTLFRCILGLNRGYTGHIEVDGTDAASISPKDLASGIAYIPQIRPQTFGYTVLEMVLMGTSHMVSNIGVPHKEQVDIAMESLEMLGIGSLADKTFTRISGGEQQLVLIARALSQRSKNLLMDEPTSALDYGNQNRVLKEVRNLADKGYCVILSTHNPQQALWYADNALALSEGAVAAFGPPKEIFTTELIERLYRMHVKIIQTEDGPLILPALGRG